MIGCADLHPNYQSEIGDIEQKISMLLTYRSGLIKEIQNLHSKRRDLGMEIKQLSEKIRKTHESLNRGYKSFKDARKERIETLSKVREIKLKIRGIEQYLRKFDYNISHKHNDIMAEKLRVAEWKLQTEKLTREEEKHLVEIVKNMELKLSTWKKAYAARQQLFQLRNQMAKLKDKLDNISLSVKEAEITFEKNKDRLSSDVKAKKQLLQEIEGLNEDVYELDSVIADTDVKLEVLRQERGSILNDIRIREMEINKSNESKLLEKARGVAKEKVAKGEKITFEELRLAFEESGEY